MRDLSLPWPLPALLTWSVAWAAFLALARLMPWWLALICACVFSTAASLWGASWWRRAMIAAGFPLSFLVLSASQLPAWGWLLPLGLLLLGIQGVSELIKRIAFLQGLIPDPTAKQGAKSAEEELAEFLLQKEVAAREAAQQGGKA